MGETFSFGLRPSHAAYHVGRWIFPFPPLSNSLVSSGEVTMLARKSIGLREKAEKQLSKTHLRPLQAPVGVASVLKCWMRIH